VTLVDLNKEHDVKFYGQFSYLERRICVAFSERKFIVGAFPTAPHHQSKILEGKVNITITIYKLARVLDYITLVPYLDVIHPPLYLI
jgi:hypothetical protein